MKLTSSIENSRLAVDDLVLLHDVTEASINETLRKRFSKDIIYTNIGPVLLVVNPFKQIPGLYSREQVDYYRIAGGGSSVGGTTTTTTTTTVSKGESTKPPLAQGGGAHVFALAEDAYRTMVAEEEDQCVIISGESGAGKTEASKQIMQYITAVSGDTQEMRRVKDIILESNPLMEAFGNAKTVRNDNSSRFGKFFQIYFDRYGNPVGGHVDTFLLEKSRVVQQQRGERNFHVFYQLCAAAAAAVSNGAGSSGSEWCGGLRLGPSHGFTYLTRGGLPDYASTDDAAGWDRTVHAMTVAGINSLDQRQVIEVLALILHLGQVGFVMGEPCSSGATQQRPCSIVDTEGLAFAAGLLGVEPEALSCALTWKKLEVGSSEVVHVPLTEQECCSARDALAKALYEGLFNFIVERVNAVLGEDTASGGGEPKEKKKKHAIMLGVLDIYGFEVFDNNGFEQLCINYVNEKLQQIFIELTLKVEQEEYVREGIPWENIDYHDNKPVCELMEGMKPPGVFAIMDDACLTMAKEKDSVADVKLLDKLDSTLGGEQHRYFQRSERGFTVKHYAGDVHYNIEGFTVRNKDKLSADPLAMLHATTNGFVRELLSAQLECFQTAQEGRSHRHTAATAGGGKTAGLKIRQQTEVLVAALRRCTPHYIRTIKPNDEKRPDVFDGIRVKHQVKYLGLLENVRVRRAGYSYRQYFERFLRRFKYLSASTYPRPFPGADRDACKAILEAIQSRHILPAGSWQLGTSKVFIRQPMHLFAIEAAREGAFHNIVSAIQRCWRSFRDRREWVRLKAHVDRIYTAQRKVRRADSVFRPFAGSCVTDLSHNPRVQTCLDLATRTAADGWRVCWSAGGLKYYANVFSQQSQWTCPQVLAPQRVIFSVKAEYLAPRHPVLGKPRRTHVCGGSAVLGNVPLQSDEEQAISVEAVYAILSNSALYVLQEPVQNIQESFVIHGSSRGKTAAGKKKREEEEETGKTRASEGAKESQEPLRLNYRLDIRLLCGVSLSHQADDIIVLHFLQIPPPWRVIPCSSMKGVKRCECCNAKLPSSTSTSSPSKRHCPCCGRICCTRRCLTHVRPLPTLLGLAKPIAFVCPTCMHGGEPLLPFEDVVLFTSSKTELLAHMCNAYTQCMGVCVPLTFSDTIEYTLAGEEARRQRLRVVVDEHVTHTTLSAAPCGSADRSTSLSDTATASSTIVARVPPPGITAAQIAAIAAARATRRAEAAERRRREEREERAREAQRVREREAERKRVVQARKHERVAAETQAAAREATKMAEEQKRRAKEAQLVAERAARKFQ